MGFSAAAHALHGMDLPKVLSSGISTAALNAANGAAWLLGQDAQLMRIPAQGPVAPSLVPHVSVPSVVFLERTKASHYASMMPAPTTSTIVVPCGSFEPRGLDISGILCDSPYWLLAFLVLFLFCSGVALAFGYVNKKTAPPPPKRYDDSGVQVDSAETPVSVKDDCNWEDDITIDYEPSAPGPQKYSMCMGLPVPHDLDDSITTPEPETIPKGYRDSSVQTDHAETPISDKSDDTWDDDVMNDYDPSAPGPQKYDVHMGSPVAHDLNESIYTLELEIPPPPISALDLPTLLTIADIILACYKSLYAAGEHSISQSAPLVQSEWERVIHAHDLELYRLLQPYLQGLHPGVRRLFEHHASGMIDRLRQTFLFNAACSSITALEAKVDVINKNLEFAKKKLEEGKKAYGEEVSSLDKRAAELSTQKKAVEDEVAELKKKVEEANHHAADEKSPLENQIADLKNKLQNASKNAAIEKQAVDKRVAALQRELQAAKSQAVTEKQTLVDEVTALEEKLQATDIRATTEKKNLEAKIADLEKQLQYPQDKAAIEKETLEGRVVELAAELEDTKNKHQKIEADLKDDAEGMEGLADAYQADFAGLNKQIKELRAERDGARDDIAGLHLDIKKLEVERNSAQEDITALSMRIIQLEAERDCALEDIVRLNEKIMNLQGEAAGGLEGLTSIIEVLEEELASRALTPAPIMQAPIARASFVQPIFARPSPRTSIDLSKLFAIANTINRAQKRFHEAGEAALFRNRLRDNNWANTQIGWGNSVGKPTTSDAHIQGLLAELRPQFDNLHPDAARFLQDVAVDAMQAIKLGVLVRHNWTVGRPGEKAENKRLTDQLMNFFHQRWQGRKNEHDFWSSDGWKAHVAWQNVEDCAVKKRVRTLEWAQSVEKEDAWTKEMSPLEVQELDCRKFPFRPPLPPTATEQPAKQQQSAEKVDACTGEMEPQEVKEVYGPRIKLPPPPLQPARKQSAQQQGTGGEVVEEQGAGAEVAEAAVIELPPSPALRIREPAVEEQRPTGGKAAENKGLCASKWAH